MDGTRSSAPKNIAILGSTGSIGRQALEVVAAHSDRFTVCSLACGHQTGALAEQIVRFRPRTVAVARGCHGFAVPDDVMVLEGEQGLIELAADPRVDLVLVATVGSIGLRPTLAALSAGKTVALANKEVLVMAGHLVNETARRHGGRLLPVDSEHSALWQCLAGEDSDTIRRLILTASGGAFRDYSPERLAQVTPREALSHPTWQMGSKVTVDSATLMNKGLEVIEARWLFDVPYDRIEVVLHRESIIHSLVEFIDGSVKAQCGPPDMRLPIQYALTYPERLAAEWPRLDFGREQRLSLAPIPPGRFLCLELALSAARRGQGATIALSGADDVAVQAFLQNRIGFTDIQRVVEAVVADSGYCRPDDLAGILDADEWARRRAEELVAHATGELG